MTLRSILALGTALALAAGQPALSRAYDLRVIDVSGAKTTTGTARLPPELPPEIVQAIRKAPKIQTILPISTAEKFNQQVIKADEIVFQSGGRIILTNLNLPWVVIAAKSIKFNFPDTYSFIQRDPSVVTAAAGGPGGAGTDQPDTTTETGRTGDPGRDGGQGGLGGGGGRQSLPDIYIITNDFLDPAGPVPPGLLNLALLVNGVDGGPGGDGGKGGNGGRGGPGKEGASSAFDCKEGGGPGGRGGLAGRGGRGGDGGVGGNGANLIYVSTRAGVDKLSFVRVNNIYGRGGNPGRGGVPGSPGGGGPGASANGWCRPTSAGEGGDYPSPASHGPGARGADGAKGSVQAIIVNSVDDIIN